MLFGKPSRMRTIVEKIILTQNTLSSSERFEINPETAVKAIRESEEDDLDLIGLFHSHSAPANPSKTDLKFMKLWGSAIWLILSLTDGQFAAFQVENGKLETVVIEVE
jgi:proteasome lid subunit RPN8/RPN11